MKPPRSPDNQTQSAMFEHIQQVNKVLTNLSYGDTMSNADRAQNMECWKASGVAPAVANTEFAITHGLGRVPLTIGGQDTSDGSVLYRSATAWTRTQVFLKCTTALAAYNVVLI